MSRRVAVVVTVADGMCVSPARELKMRGEGAGSSWAVEARRLPGGVYTNLILISVSSRFTFLTHIRTHLPLSREGWCAVVPAVPDLTVGRLLLHRLVIRQSRQRLQCVGPRVCSSCFSSSSSRLVLYEI